MEATPIADMHRSTDRLRHCDHKHNHSSDRSYVKCVHPQAGLSSFFYRLWSISCLPAKLGESWESLGIARNRKESLGIARDP